MEPKAGLDIWEKNLLSLSKPPGTSNTSLVATPNAPKWLSNINFRKNKLNGSRFVCRNAKIECENKVRVTLKLQRLKDV